MPASEEAQRHSVRGEAPVAPDPPAYHPLPAQSPTLDSTLCSHPTKRWLRATTFPFPVRWQNPRKKIYFYKLRGSPCSSRGSLQAFSFHGLFSLSPWLKNLVTYHFLMVFCSIGHGLRFRQFGGNCLSLSPVHYLLCISCNIYLRSKCVTCVYVIMRPLIH